MSSAADKWVDTFKRICSNLQPSSINGSHINILFFGPPGHGKSASANSTLGEKRFVVSCDGVADVTTVESARTTFEDYSLKIVDCLAAPRKNPNKSKKVLIECGRILSQILKPCPQGFHAVFLVLKFGNRFDEEEEFAMTMLLEMFGPSFVEDHCFCLISHGDMFQREMESRGEDTNFHDWCWQQKGVLQKMFKACKYKCLLFDNLTTDMNKRKQQVQQLMKCVINSWPQNFSLVSVSPELRIKADIQMIVESAPSDDTFRDQLRFVIGYTENWDPNDRSMNFNVKIFGEERHINYHMNQFKSHPEFAEELLKAEYLKACKGIDHTLEVVRNESSTRELGDVKQLAIVLTEGRSQDDAKAANEAAQLKNSGTQLMMVGVNSVDRHKLENLASEPENVFMAENYEELQHLPNEIKHRAAEIAPQFETTANVLFILDSSGSISPADYEKEKNFAIRVTNAFNIGPGALHFSAMIFSGCPQMIFDFSLTTHEEIAKEIRKVAHLRQSTDTAAALQLARSLAFTPRRGVESGKKIALVITDGCSNIPIETAQEAEELSLSGVLVLAIGVGPAVNEDELRAIATRPEDVYTVDNFDVLQTIRDEIADRTCILETAMTAQGARPQSPNSTATNSPDHSPSQGTRNPDNNRSSPWFPTLNSGSFPWSVNSAISA